MEQRHTTSNNVKVYSYRQPHLHSFCIGLYVKAGALYEGPGESGITHFLEHVLFRNLGGMPQQELYEKLEGMGAYFNACTYKEFVQFYITATPAYFAECADIVARLLAPLAVSAKDVNVERKRIQSEIREEDYQKSLEYLSTAEIWKDTALSNPIMGTITGIAGIGLAELRAAKDDMFQAANLCFYVTGRFTDGDIAALCRLIEQSQMGQGSARRNAAPKPSGFQSRGGAIRIINSTELPCLCFSFDILYSKYSMAEIQLLYDILFKGSLSRFQTQLSVRKGLIYSFDSVLDQYGDIGTITVEYSIAAGKLYDAIALTTGIFRSAKNDIGEADLAYHLPRYRDNYDILLDEPERLNWDMAFDNFILERDFKSIDDVKNQYTSVRAGRLMEIARETFLLDNLTLVIKASKKKCREEAVRERISTL